MPVGILLKDPSKLHREDTKTILQHWKERQDDSDVDTTFTFKAFLNKEKEVVEINAQRKSTERARSDSDKEPEAVAMSVRKPTRKTGHKTTRSGTRSDSGSDDDDDDDDDDDEEEEEEEEPEAPTRKAGKPGPKPKPKPGPQPNLNPGPKPKPAFRGTRDPDTDMWMNTRSSKRKLDEAADQRRVKQKTIRKGIRQGGDDPDVGPESEQPFVGTTHLRALRYGIFSIIMNFRLLMSVVVEGPESKIPLMTKYIHIL